MATVTYKNQPGTAGVLKQGTPLAGTSHVYKVEKVLWPEAVEQFIDTLLLPQSCHLCCGKSKLGDVRVDLHQDDVDFKEDAAHTHFADNEFESVLCDPPYNGKFQWNHDLLKEMARICNNRLIFQHWFMPIDSQGRFKKLHDFTLKDVYVWQPRTYFGRVQVISVMEKNIDNGNT